MSIIELGSKEAVRQYVANHAETPVVLQNALKKVRILPSCEIVISGIVKAHYTSGISLESSLESFSFGENVCCLLMNADYALLGDEVANEGLPVPQELLRTIEYLAKEGPKKFLPNSTFFHVVNDKDIEKYPLLMEVLGIVDSLIYDPVDEEVYVDYCGCPWWYSACEDDEVAWSIFKKVQEVFKEAFIERVTKL